VFLEDLEETKRPAAGNYRDSSVSKQGRAGKPAADRTEGS